MTYRSAIGAGCAALATIVMLVTAAQAEAPVIWDPHSTLRAKVVPAADWCASVVSVDLHATQSVFEKSSEEVQRFIGAIRASVLYECPVAEIIRIRGIAGKVGMFLAYTVKASDWNIRVFPSIRSVLPVLAAKESSATSSRDLAYFETKTQFDRAKLENVAFDTASPADETERVAWQMDGIEGVTYVLTDRRAHHRSLKDFADAAAQIFVDRCVKYSGGMPQNAASGDVVPNMLTRTFDCTRGGAPTGVAVIIKEVDNVTVIFAMNSERKSLLNTLVKFIADKSIAY